METVTFKLQERIIKKIDRLLRPLNFSNRTEFIREAVRDKLNKIEKEIIIIELMKFKGISKKKTTKKEYEMIRRKAFAGSEKTDTSDIFRKLNLD